MAPPRPGEGPHIVRSARILCGDVGGSLVIEVEAQLNGYASSLFERISWPWERLAESLDRAQAAWAPPPRPQPTPESLADALREAQDMLIAKDLRIAELEEELAERPVDKSERIRDFLRT